MWTAVTWAFAAGFLLGIFAGIALAWAARASVRRHQALTGRADLPEPDTIEHRNARALAQWTERAQHARREQ